MADTLLVDILYNVSRTPLQLIRNASNVAGNAARRLEQQLGNTSSRFNQLGRNARAGMLHAERGISQARRRLEELNNTGQNTNSTFQNLKNVAGTFISIAAVKTAISTFASFEDKMLKVKSLVGDVTEKEFKGLENQAKKLGATTAFSASQVAEAQGNMAQSGFKVNEILNATPSILTLASAATLDMGRSAEIVSKSLNLFNLNAKESARVADVIAKAQATSTADANFLASALFNVGAAANSMKYDIEKTTSLVAALASGFDDGSAAGTSVAAALRDMSANAKKFKALGISIADSSGKFRNLEDVVEDLKNKTSKLTDAQRKQTVSNLFGVFAQKSVNLLMENGVEKVRKYDKELRSSSGTSKKMADIMESGLGGSFRSFLSALEGTAISVVTLLNPALKTTIGIATSFLSKFTELTETSLTFKIALGVLVGSIVAYKTVSLAAFVVTKAIDIWTATTSIPTRLLLNLSILKGAALWVGYKVAALAAVTVSKILTAAQWALNIALNANPIGLIVAGVAALVGVGYLLYRNFDTIKEKAIGLWKTLESNPFTNILLYLNPVTLAIKGIIAGFRGIKKVIDYFSKDKKNINAQATITTLEKTVDGTHKTGLNYVPKDGYIAELHKGERVLTKEENISYSNTKNNNTNFNSNKNNSSTNININVPINIEMPINYINRIKESVKNIIEEYQQEQLSKLGIREVSY